MGTPEDGEKPGAFPGVPGISVSRFPGLEGPRVLAADAQAAQAKEVEGLVPGMARAKGEAAADGEGLVGQIRGAQGAGRVGYKSLALEKLKRSKEPNYTSTSLNKCILMPICFHLDRSYIFCSHVLMGKIHFVSL